MKPFAYIIIASIIICILLYLRNKKRRLKFKKSLVVRFKNKLKLKNRFREKVKVNFSDSLMANPNTNIKISIWDKENFLREKAEIHRARLCKYGHSKLNGEIFFRDKNGEIYKNSSKGEKIYI